MNNNVSYDLLKRQEKMLEEQNKKLPSTEKLEYGGDGPYDPDMEARVAVLEEIARKTEALLERMDARMTRIEEREHSDFMKLLTFGLGATAVLLATMAHGFHWL